MGKLRKEFSSKLQTPYSIRSAVSRGFTLIELVAITAIIALITGLILVSDSAFGGKVLLENLAYDLALSVRQAQVYGISVQRFGTNTFTFNAGYGVHFDTANASQYLTFADACTPADGIYTTLGGACPLGELVTTTQIERGFRILYLCAPAGSAYNTCTQWSSLDIVFKRPEPDAIISAGGFSCPLTLGTCFDSARIVVMSPRGDKASVIVYLNGQISVEKSN